MEICYAGSSFGDIYIAFEGDISKFQSLFWFGFRGQDFSLWPKLPTNSQSSRLSLPRTRMTGMHHHTGLKYSILLSGLWSASGNFKQMQSLASVFPSQAMSLGLEQGHNGCEEGKMASRRSGARVPAELLTILQVTFPALTQGWRWWALPFKTHGWFIYFCLTLMPHLFSIQDLNGCPQEKNANCTVLYC